MMRNVSLAALFLVFSVGHAETSYLALYMQGQRVGYSATTESTAKRAGAMESKTDSVTVMDTALLGTPLNLRMDSTTFSVKGRPTEMQFRITSAGLNQTVRAVFGKTDVTVDVDNIGKKSRTKLVIPKGAVVDDPVTAILAGTIKPGQAQSFNVFDPMTVTFVTNKVVNRGPGKVTTEKGPLNATVVDIVDPRTTTTVYLNAKGDLIKAVSGMGIEMRPVTKAVALAPTGSNPGTTDLAEATRIKPTGTVESPRTITALSLAIEGRDLSAIPNDAHQTVTGSGTAWTVDIHPPVIDETAPLGKFAGPDAAWLKPSLNLPADSTRMKTLATRLTNGKSTVAEAAKAIHGYVYGTMTPNAGIGVLRNAEQVLDTKEGVCRDYAVLTTTLMRAARIPARLVGGMVFAEGAFYYHAWTEIWDGKNWIGIDSTLPEFQISASHLKLAHGNVDKAFTFTFLENTRIAIK